jgi:hypothetical protein
VDLQRSFQFENGGITPLNIDQRIRQLRFKIRRSLLQYLQSSALLLPASKLIEQTTQQNMSILPITDVALN